MTDATCRPSAKNWDQLRNSLLNNRVWAAFTFFCQWIYTVGFTSRRKLPSVLLPSVLWHCWLGGRKGIWSVKNWVVWGAGVVICLEWGADLHMAQLMPLPLTVSCFSNIQIGFAFLVPAHPGSPGQRAVKRVCVWGCVCVCVCFSHHEGHLQSSPVVSCTTTSAQCCTETSVSRKANFALHLAGKILLHVFPVISWGNWSSVITHYIHTPVMTHEFVLLLNHRFIYLNVISCWQWRWNFLPDITVWWFECSDHILSCDCR